MKRRDCLALGMAAVLGPAFAARAQDGARRRRVGVLLRFSESDPRSPEHLKALVGALQRLGWDVGRNLDLDVRWSGVETPLLDRYADEIVRLGPEVILCHATASVKAVLAVTRSVPIVFILVTDPVGEGFVSSLARPGAKVTGFSNAQASLGGKWLDLLKELVPGTAPVGVIHDPPVAGRLGTYYLDLVKQSAAKKGLRIVPLPLHSPAELKQSVAAFARQRNGGLIVTPGIRVARDRKLVIELAATHRLATIYGISYYADEGGLMAYGIDVDEQLRQAAGYVDQILRGASPEDLPVQEPSTLEFIVNQRTARALGVHVPSTLLLRADRVIE